jgi:23S rRNA (pseudouridine1915-N3)-methyltransferase
MPELSVIAVGDKVPSWVQEGVDSFAKRLPKPYAPTVKTVSAISRKQRDSQRCKQEEGDKLLAGVPKGSRIIVLDEHGQSWSSKKLAGKLEGWMTSGQGTAFLIGGADGLSPTCLSRAESHWSLSALTFPHALVRVLLMEQLYRAWTLISHHPYHRA